MWERIATHLRMDVRTVQARTPARQFLRWRVFLAAERRAAWRRQWKDRHREDWYAAQTAREIYILRLQVANMLSRNPLKVDRALADFLIPFTTSPGGGLRAKTADERAADRTAYIEAVSEASRARHMAIAGYDPATGRLVTRQPPDRG